MSTGITPENEQFLREQIAAGMFSSRDDVLNAGLNLLKQRQDLIARIHLSRAQLDSGEYTEYDSEGLVRFFDELRAELPSES